MNSIIIFIIGLPIYLMFISTLSSLLKSVEPANRKINPNSVYLLIIPIFDIFWSFVVTNRVADSIEAEFRGRNINCEPRPTYRRGYIWSVVGVLKYIILFFYLMLLLVIIEFKIDIGSSGYFAIKSIAYIYIACIVMHFVFWSRYWHSVFKQKELLAKHK